MIRNSSQRRADEEEGPGSGSGMGMGDVKTRPNPWLSISSYGSIKTSGDDAEGSRQSQHVPAQGGWFEACSACLCGAPAGGLKIFRSFACWRCAEKSEVIHIARCCGLHCPHLCCQWSDVAVWLVLINLAVFGTLWISVDYLMHTQTESHIVAWYSSGIFVLLAVPISLREIIMHLLHFFSPELQVYVVRILWMVPIYACESWLSLRFKTHAVLIETAREAYEAYVIYNCVYLFFGYLGGEERIVQDSLRRNDPSKEQHLFPFNYILLQWPTGAEFVENCKLGVLQYVIIKLFLTALTFYLESHGNYEEGNLDPNGWYLWITIANNVSQIWAMYCLMLFYYSYHDELEGFHPLSKLVCVKAVVFFSFWQGVVIAILVKQGMITSTYHWTTEEIARGTQDYLICIEMVFAAIAHLFSFSYKDFEVQIIKSERKPLLQALVEVTTPREAYVDTIRVGTGVGRALANYGQSAAKLGHFAIHRTLTTVTSVTSIVRTRMQKIHDGGATGVIVQVESGQDDRAAPVDGGNFVIVDAEDADLTDPYEREALAAAACMALSRQASAAELG